MGVRITDTETVALYDSVAGFAFGPIFSSETDADGFLEWLTEEAAKGREFEYNNDKLLVLENVLAYRKDELLFLKEMWEKERRA